MNQTHRMSDPPYELMMMTTIHLAMFTRERALRKSLQGGPHSSGSKQLLHKPASSPTISATIPFEAISYGVSVLACRTDTFSLGVCNGCQLMALLGWIPGGALQDVEQPRFVHNTSGRFECRWATVEIRPSPSVLLKVS